MKILLVTGIYPPDIGGPATYTRTMARALKERGHEVEVVCYGEEGEGRGAFPLRSRRLELRGDAEGEETFKVWRVSRSWSLPVRYALFAWKVFCRSMMMRADVVFLQGPGSEGLPGTVGAMLAGTPAIMKIVGDYAWEIYQGQGGKEILNEFVLHRHAGKIGFLEMIERWTVKRAKLVITPSVYLKGIVEKWGIVSEKIFVIYNAITSETSWDERSTVRTRFGFEEERVLFYGGRAVPWKHVDFIIRLLPRLPDDVLFVIGGDGPSLDAWKAEVKALNMENRVMFPGVLDRRRMNELYRASDLFILPSGYEGFPNVIPEAVAAGLHCFVSDMGGNPETQQIFGSERITVLPYLDESAWLDALRKPWPDRGSTGLPALFSTNRMIEQTEEKLQSIL